MAFKKVAEISIDKLEDRKTVTAILHANGYTVGPGKRKKTPTGKQLDYYLKVYKEVEEDGKDEESRGVQGGLSAKHKIRCSRPAVWQAEAKSDSQEVYWQ